MEDQRNWTDASFKTYCRPQSWPQPYEVADGDKIEHRLKLSFDGAQALEEPPCRVNLRLTGLTVPLPKIGTIAKSLAPGFDFFLNPDEPEPWSSIGLGKIHAVAGNFADLNRNRPDLSNIDGVAFAATPQNHAYDERTVMENTQGLYDPVVTARTFTNKQVCVGPISFRPNHLGRDDRLDREIGPAWFLASLVSLAQAGATAACFLGHGDFRGELGDALELVVEAREIGLYESDDPYRAIAFRVGEKDVIVNMRSFATAVNLKGDWELEPYQVKIM